MLLAPRDVFCGRRGRDSCGQKPPPLLPHGRPRGTGARLLAAGSALAARWGLPSILFVAGLGMVAVVALTGPSAAPQPPAGYAAPLVRPSGPMPVTWIDDGVLADPALAAR